MTSYIIRRILLMIPTFIGITVLYFLILQIVPGGPLEQEIMRIKAAQMMSGEGGSGGGSVSGMGNEVEISPEALEKMKKFYGFDKPILVRYLLWLGLWQRDINEKEFKYTEPFRFSVDYVQSGNDQYELQKWVKVEKEDKQYQVYESGVAADFAFESYAELPNWKEIDNWYEANDWKIEDLEMKKVPIDSVSKTVTFIDSLTYDSYLQNGKPSQTVDSYATGVAVPMTYFGKLDEILFADAQNLLQTRAYGALNDSLKNVISEKFDKDDWYRSQGYQLKFDDDKMTLTHYLYKHVYKMETPEEFASLDLHIYKEDSVRVYQNTFSGVITGNLGDSYTFREPVTKVVLDRIHISAYFGIIGMFLTYLICIPLGIYKAILHGSKFDAITSIIVFIGYAIPGFALGILLLMLLGGGSFWDVFPLGGFRSPNWEELGFFEKIWDQIHHTILPMISWFIGSFATMTILMKNSLLENLGQDYVRTAFAKGLSERRVIFIHAVRNSLIPLATGIGGIIGIVFAGSYLIEKTFNINGIGLMSFEALLSRDYPILLGFLVIGSIIKLIGNLISDMCYAAIDPRIRFR